MKEIYLTYTWLKKRDPIKFLSEYLDLDEYYIQEIYRMCETDFRFNKNSLVEYQEIAEELKKMSFGHINLNPRQIKYIHRVIKTHYDLQELLKRGGKISGSYRDLVLRKS